MVILYEIHSFRIIDVPGCNDNVADFEGFADNWIDWKLVAESSEFHLTLRRAHKAYFPQIEIPKMDILKRVYIEFKYYADAIHFGLTPPGNNNCHLVMFADIALCSTKREHTERKLEEWKRVM